MATNLYDYKNGSTQQQLRALIGFMLLMSCAFKNRWLLVICWIPTRQAILGWRSIEWSIHGGRPEGRYCCACDGGGTARIKTESSGFHQDSPEASCIRSVASEKSRHVGYPIVSMRTSKQLVWLCAASCLLGSRADVPMVSGRSSLTMSFAFKFRHRASRNRLSLWNDILYVSPWSQCDQADGGFVRC